MTKISKISKQFHEISYLKSRHDECTVVKLLYECLIDSLRIKI